MKIIAKLAVASVIALSAAPAFAASINDVNAEVTTTIERNAFLSSQQNGAFARAEGARQVRAHRGVDAFASSYETNMVEGRGDTRPY